MGIGKSATARALGKRLGWPVVDKDDASDVLLKYLEVYGPAAYDIMFKQAESLIMQGFNVIVDSPLRGEIGYKRALEFSQELDFDLGIIDCTCTDQKTWQERLETRTRRPAHILKTWADFETYWAKAEADFDYPITSPCLTIDTRQELEQNINQIVNWLI